MLWPEYGGLRTPAAEKLKLTSYGDTASVQPRSDREVVLCEIENEAMVFWQVKIIHSELELQMT